MFNSTIFNKKFKIAFFLLLLLILILLILLLIPKGKKTGKVNQGQTADQRQTVDNKNSINQKTSEKKLLYDLSSTQALPSPKNEDNYKEAKKITLAPEIAPKNISSEEKLKIAENVVNWLTALKQNENGEEIFSIGYICNPGKPCEKAPTDRQVTFPVIWAMYHYYLKTKKPETLNLIKQIINSYSDRPLQPDFWHCKLLFSFNQSNFFSSPEKEKINKLCKNTYLLRINKTSSNLENNDINKINAEEIINKIKNKLILNEDNFTPTQNEKEFLIYSAYISDFVYRYFIFKEPTNLYFAKAYLDQILINFDHIQITELPYFIISLIDIYKATQNEQYLKIIDSLTKIAFENKLNNSFNLVGLLLLEDELFQITRNDKYQEIKQELISELVNKAYINNTDIKAFHSISNNRIYDTMLNSLIAFVLLK